MNYKLSISKSKNARIFYIQTSYRKGAKVCTKTVKKLGNETFIKETYGVEDAEAWARAELERMRQAAREDMEQFLQKKVFLQLFVKVSDDWRNNERQLRRFGYEQE